MIINCDLGLARAFISGIAYPRLLINLDQDIDDFDIVVNIDDLREIRVSVLAKVAGKSKRAVALEEAIWDEIRSFFCLIPFMSPWEFKVDNGKAMIPLIRRAIKLFQKEHSRYKLYVPTWTMYLLHDSDYFAELKVWMHGKQGHVRVDGENKDFIKEEAMLMAWYLDKSINNQPNNFWK